LAAQTEDGAIPMVTGTIRQGVPAGLGAKFDALLGDAEKKLARQPSGQLLLFVCLAIDFPGDRDAIRAWVANWGDTVARTRGVSVVLCHRTEWREPFHVSWA
jgi:hypothetical protein